MATSAIRPKSAVVAIVALMALPALAGRTGRSGFRPAMTGAASKADVFAGQCETGGNIMIEKRCVPRSGVVTGATLLPQRTTMWIVGGMTVHTAICGIMKSLRLVATGANHVLVQSQ